jgi:hypothetical protein
LKYKMFSQFFFIHDTFSLIDGPVVKRALDLSEEALPIV